MSYFILHVDYPIMYKGTVVTEYYFILLDTKMVPIAYYLIVSTSVYRQTVIYFFSHMVKRSFTISQGGRG